MFKRIYGFGLIITSLTFQACDNQETTMIGNSSNKLPDEVSYNFHVRPILSDNCFACHGPDANKREASLRLDIEEEAFRSLEKTPDVFALVPGNPHASEVYNRVVSDDPSVKMPPPDSNLKLTDFEISMIKKWISQGAEYEPHWSFLPPEKVKIPKVDHHDWVKNEIDYFILKKLEEKGFKPNEEADKESLLKRLSFDLTGLPPSLEMMDDFLEDPSEDAYSNWVDRMLSSQAYGEKMAVYWMDIARFADSHGFQDDSYRSQWPWRDWVIHAFNENMPYDQFITWQLAGDLLPDPTKEQLLATGFNRNHKITEEGGIVDEEYRVMYVTDRTNTFGKALIGITMECAGCHDHKYDPVSQKEYYQLYSFFNNIREKGIESVVGGPETYAKRPFMEITDEDVDSILAFINKPDTTQLIVSIMGELDSARTSYVLERGSYEAHGEAVKPSMPESILAFNPEFERNRLGLAKWLFDKKNPLTARVFVNQIWQEIFGKGIVATPGDFGMQGELPSHPELLDWLALDFMENGWDIKRLVRQMVTSATYKQSAVISDEKKEQDPENIFLSRAPRYRLKAEFVRDLILSSSGLLDATLGGPSVKPYQPSGLWEGATSGRGILSVYKQDHGKDLYRRGLYNFIKRTVPPPAMTLFDASNRDQCEVERLITNTPLQALVMLNDPTMLEASRVLAGKLLKEKMTAEQRIQKAFRMIVCRFPEQREVDVLIKYHSGQLKTMANENAKALLNVGEYPLEDDLDPVEWASLMQVISTIYNLEETISKT
ncbi:PSD1 and planctomycete cytochrome C domain-containing protein [Cyclobacterium jeungdonense]|uniref:PSD1 and planctomycete cytochrome C domain-containing protein n=1 Tax=Cyclobacterium jeungdonense TaxID=708087 RepID=A0ABT8CC01_9BACT|nr:PSD1 and planctomycete cytochrome C domain-containing protein [Cyclobacterium jeungdonense]MDN3690035.1 PSD1 and planctomycete cytochrome C domain-containing protein [Cyclobacterium jeungdonense]